MDEQEILYTMALTRQSRLNSNQQQLLLSQAGSATAVFENRQELAHALQANSPHAAQALLQLESVLPRCTQELAYAQQHRIRMLCWNDPAFPARLRNCEDAPILLYYLGNANLNAAHVVSMVGTRHCTERGRDICQQFVAELKRLCPDVLVMSGLAYGIDVASHRACVEQQVPTVGVLAHGLDEIYPRVHRSTAIEMLRCGGLLTEYMSQTRSEKMNFVQRNRIVAGMADATVVVESAAKGGSLITAEMANGYHREVFTFPGRVSDAASAGCNALIRRNQATLITCAADLMADMQWEPAPQPGTEAARQTTLFPDLTPDEQRVADALAATDADPSLAELATTLGMPQFKLTPILLTLEMKGVVKLKAGQRYHLVR